MPSSTAPQPDRPDAQLVLLVTVDGGGTAIFELVVEAARPAEAVKVSERYL